MGYYYPPSREQSSTSQTVRLEVEFGSRTFWLLNAAASFEHLLLEVGSSLRPLTSASVRGIERQDLEVESIPEQFGVVFAPQCHCHFVTLSHLSGSHC